MKEVEGERRNSLQIPEGSPKSERSELTSFSAYGAYLEQKEDD